METFFEKDYVRVSYNAESHYMLHEWLIPPTPAEFKEGCEQLLNAFKHHKTIKVIIDTRGQGVIASEVMEWMTTNWVPRMISAGYKYGAIILPNEIFAHLSVEEIMKKNSEEIVSEGIVSAEFDNMEAALKWIKLF